MPINTGNQEHIISQRSMTEKMIRKNIQSELEKDLTLIGVTAMEDLLQDSVE